MSSPVAVKKFANSGSVISRFTFRAIRKSTLIFAILAGFMTVLQGLAYSASYSDNPAVRDQFISTLKSSPALGMLYGNPADAVTSTGYIMYRCLPFLSLIGAIWGLLVATRLFRGAEEDGRWELLLAGQTTPRRAIWRSALGMGAALFVVIVASSLILLINNTAKDIAIPIQNAFGFGLCISGVSAVFMAVGAFTSQLGATRRRATLYGIIPLVILYAVRAAAHIIHDGDWLLSWTPFGWAEKVHPLSNSHMFWLLPLGGLVAVFGLASAWLAGKRDLGDSIIAGPDVIRPRYGLLSSVQAFSVRLTLPSTISWAIIAMALAGMLAALAKTAQQAVADSSSLTDAFSSFAGGNNSIVLAFIAMGTFFSAAVLMAMAASGVGAIRSEEARSYLDNILVRPFDRAKWLAVRIGVLSTAIIAITVACNVVILLTARATGVHLNVSDVMLGGLNILGPLALLLGIGVLFYGWLPRWASVVMYSVFGWSFIIDMVGSVVHLNKVLANTSLFRHVSLTPAVHPDWIVAAIAAAAGIILVLGGIYGFTKRDLEAE